MDDTQSMPAQPRKLGQLLSDSLNLTLTGFWNYVAIIAASLIPYVLISLALGRTDIWDRELMKQAMMTGQWAQVLGVFLLCF